MARVLALDVGAKTIGVAISDETETFVFPGKTILRQEGYRRDMGALRQLVESEQIGEIVVGLPLMLDGSHGIQAEKIEAFAGILRRYVRVPIHLHDERLSTFEADQLLEAAGRRREDRKKTIDSIAAAVILQSFLDVRARERA